MAPPGQRRKLVKNVLPGAFFDLYAVCVNEAVVVDDLVYVHSISFNSSGVRSRAAAIASTSSLSYPSSTVCCSLCTAHHPCRILKINFICTGLSMCSNTFTKVGATRFDRVFFPALGAIAAFGEAAKFRLHISMSSTAHWNCRGIRLHSPGRTENEMLRLNDMTDRYTAALAGKSPFLVKPWHRCGILAARLVRSCHLPRSRT
ncbi:hypothetical protein ABH973_000696 [Bradyrhizobium ottawaense]